MSLAVLGLVTGAPMSGYDVRKVFATTPLGRFSSSPGAIYPALARLEREGLLSAEVENVNTLRPRRVYSTTEKGLGTLRMTLRRPVTKDDVIWREGQLMLRFVFMEKTLAPEETLRFLEQFRAGTEEYVGSLKQILTNYPAEGRRHARLALIRGIEGHERDIRWATDALEELGGEVTDVDTQEGSE